MQEKIMSEEENMKALAAAFDDHQVTDDEGQILEEETSTQESAFEEENTEEEVTDEIPESTTEDDETPVADESGKEYVPKKAFEKNYAKRKEAERRAAELEAQLEALKRPQPKRPVPIVDKNEALENELLFTKMPEFDPYSEKYNPTLDEQAAFIYNSYRDDKGKPQITKLQAAREAKRIAEELTRPLASSKAEVRQVKMQTEGAFSGAARKVDTTPRPDEMSLDDMEQYLKTQGAWDKFN